MHHISAHEWISHFFSSVQYYVFLVPSNVMFVVEFDKITTDYMLDHHGRHVGIWPWVAPSSYKIIACNTIPIQSPRCNLATIYTFSWKVWMCLNYVCGSSISSVFDSLEKNKIINTYVALFCPQFCSTCHKI